MEKHETHCSRRIRETLWTFRPKSPLRIRIRCGGTLLLEPGHSFTGCLWPAVDDYEPDVCAALAFFLKPGHVFVDCGANVGYFSVIAGKIVGSAGRVIAIEANPVTYVLLERNLRANQLGTGVNLAVTSREGEVELFVPPTGDIFSVTQPGGLVSTSNAEVIKVKAQTLPEMLSSLNINRVDLIKVDVEGGELDILESSADLLRKRRPVVICEYGTTTWPAFGATIERLEKLLHVCQYKSGIFDVKSQAVVPVQAWVWNSPYANLILQPR